MESLLNEYGIENQKLIIESFGNGLINNTWIVCDDSQKYILQKVNHNVFKDPHSIAYNISCLDDFFKSRFPDYPFVSPVKTSDGNSLLFREGEGYFRLFPFIKNSRSIDVVQTPAQAYEAATQFGKFTRLLHDFDATKLRATIPDFHNLSLRYSQFLTALEYGNSTRIEKASEIINQLQDQSGIVEIYNQITANHNFVTRVIHHDTKISNVLFDEKDQGLCVIDLDTVMPGYFISDVGDMMRTYLSPVSEEESNFSKIEVRQEFYQAVLDGYYGEMKDVLTEVEREYFFYAGQFMIYMQAIRFLTDYLNNDTYYGEKYPGHNLVRATNQTVLLQRLNEKENVLNKKF